MVESQAKTSGKKLIVPIGLAARVVKTYVFLRFGGVSTKASKAGAYLNPVEPMNASEHSGLGC
jgi:hypothetical protein